MSRRAYKLRSPDLIRQVESCIHDRRLILPGRLALVAVSGGVDSMVLLHVLHRLAARNDWRLTVAHLDHQLRGHESSEDAQFVRRSADALGLETIIGREDVSAIARELGVSIEMAARTARHKFLATAARNQRAGVVALAHHADDQVELFLLRLLRGSGSQGLGGMEYRAPSPSDPNLELVRPLLNFAKSELCAFAASEGIAFREDSTNGCFVHERNRVRHELIPYLKRAFEPAVDQVLLRTADILKAEHDVIRQLADEYLRRAARSRSPQTPGFEDLALAIQRECVRAQLLNLGVTAGFDHIESLCKKPGKAVQLSKGVWVARDEGGTVTRTKPFVRNFNDEALALHLATKPEGEAIFSGLRIKYAIRCEETAGVTRGLQTESFDVDRVGDSVVLRHWRPGDRFQPIGMRHTVKLQDFFVNRKVSREARSRLVLGVTGDGRVFWVEGQRISEHFKLTPHTKRRLFWQWTRP